MADAGEARTPDELRLAIQQMCAEAVEMLRLAREGFRQHDAAALEAAAHRGKVVHGREKELTDYVVSHWHTFPREVRDILFIPTHLERIGDNVESLVRCVEMIRRERIHFTDRAVRDIAALFERGIALLECVRDLIPTRNRMLMRYVVKGGEEFQALAAGYVLAHQERLIQGVCLPEASSSFLAVIDYLKEIERHTRRIVHKMTAQN